MSTRENLADFSLSLMENVEQISAKKFIGVLS